MKGGGFYDLEACVAECLEETLPDFGGSVVEDECEEGVGLEDTVELAETPFHKLVVCGGVFTLGGAEDCFVCGVCESADDGFPEEIEFGVGDVPAEGWISESVVYGAVGNRGEVCGGAGDDFDFGVVIDSLVEVD